MITFKKGGVHPAENKFAKQYSIEYFPLTKQATILLNQHMGVPAVVQVQKGDKVKVGQLIGKGEAFISANVHSPFSGTVAKIDQAVDISGYKREAVVIDVEGDEWLDTIDKSEEIKKEITLSKQEIIDRIKECGIVGLGGACFPTHVKYMVPPDKKVDYLIINAAECEPYITADHRMMLEKTEECMVGIQALLVASGAPVALIGIENNKKDAIEKMSQVAQQYPNIKVCPVKTKYPQGAEKQLIQALINRRVPNGKLPIEVGVIANNITTAYSVYEAVQKNKPLIETTMTVTGKKLEKPHNFRVRIGTPLNEILQSIDFPENTGKIISGGPMMGKAIAEVNTFVSKGMSSLLLMDESESKRDRVYPCLRCGKCIGVCPMGLQPYILQAFSELKRYEDCESYGIMNCIECGSCQYGCPSFRPLLDYIRTGKAKTGLMNRNRKK